MGHTYTDTTPLPFGKKHHFEFAVLFPALTPATIADPIRCELQRRIDGCNERRRAAALSPGNDDDFAAWNREVARSRKLTHALIRHLTR
jgi:hypothetical protein